MVQKASEKEGLGAEADAVLQFQIALMEAPHNMALLHLLHCITPMLAQNVEQDFALLYVFMFAKRC